jgi:hypothetical protein
VKERNLKRRVMEQEAQARVTEVVNRMQARLIAVTSSDEGEGFIGFQTNDAPIALAFFAQTNMDFHYYPAGRHGFLPCVFIARPEGVELSWGGSPEEGE